MRRQVCAEANTGSNGGNWFWSISRKQMFTKIKLFQIVKIPTLLCNYTRQWQKRDQDWFLRRSNRHAENTFRKRICELHVNFQPLMARSLNSFLVIKQWFSFEKACFKCAIVTDKLKNIYGFAQVLVADISLHIAPLCFNFIIFLHAFIQQQRHQYFKQQQKRR